MKENYTSVIELIELMTKTFKYESERNTNFTHGHLNTLTWLLQTNTLVGKIKMRLEDGCAYVQYCTSYMKMIGLSSNNIGHQGLNLDFLLTFLDFNNL